MKSDVANIQLKERRKVSFAQGALIAVVLVIATKFCTLPSVLAGAAGSKAVWVVMLLVAWEFAILFFAAKTAKCGGILALPLKRGIRIPLLLLFALFFALKLTAFAREISTYYALSLFENMPVLPIMIIHLAACALLARQGYMAIGRLMEIFVWLFVFVFLFVVIFTRSDGDLFNTLGMFSPDLTGMGKGFYRGLAWFGDGVILSFLDLSGETRFSPHAKGIPTPPVRTRAKKKIVLAAALFSLLLVVLFHAVFTSVYGDAAKMTDYAFIKLSAFKANADELGSADWPVLILWALVSCLYIALLFLSGRECFLGIRGKSQGQKGNVAIPFLLFGLIAVLVSTIWLDEEGDYERFMTKIMSFVSILAAVASVGTGIFALSLKKGGKHEEQN